MKRLILGALLALSAVNAQAQSLPYPIVQGTIWTVPQWISAWQSKADVTAVSGGASSNFNAAFPTVGAAMGAYNAGSGNMVSVGADNSGDLYVNCAFGCGSLPTNASTASNQTLALQGVTPGPVATNSTLMGGVYYSTPITNTNGQGSALQMDANGYLKVNVAVGGGTGGTSSNFAATFPSVGTAIGGKYSGNMVSIAADGSSNLMVDCNVGCAGGSTSNASSGVATQSNNGQQIAYNYAFNGTTWDQLQDDASKNLKVNLATAVPAGTNLMGKVGIDQTTVGTTNGVSIAAVGTNAIVSGGVNGSQSVGGPTATGSAIAANPVTTGGRAQNAERTAVSNGQVVDRAMDLVGRQIVFPFANKENILFGTTAAITTATNTQIIAAQASGIKIYITAFSCSNTGANTSLVQLTSGSGGSVIWQSIAPVQSGTNMTFPVPISTAAATALYVTTGTASSSIYCSAEGFSGT